ncbi:carboxylesterase [Pleionea sp. CnH1-48]|uniref:alpha/beta hydrolase n=1 Tax=Pleionea sp. CnH1-48 TaxID=2954494 RepID=UPI0020984BA5|nr:alpha/beta fold hydrolase [Pleionea sp. CnH1-48]MCO7223260.1 alpha/beta fold hydrolase [Pleionea sp. CnH1-48]
MNHTFIRIVLTLTLLIVNVGCSTLSNSHAPLFKSQQYYNYIQPSFAEYLKTTKTWLSSNRAYITSAHDKEVSMNMPFELTPEQPSSKAILLVHGLGDSPYSFSDLAVTLRAQGFHVRTLLLPGHGSKPDDLKLPGYNDWQTAVDHYANLMKQEFEQVWLGGFSTGANLVTIHAVKQGNIDGLLLFSPGFQSQAPFLEKLAPFVSLFTDGYTAKEHNIARYTSAPINGAIAYSDSAERLRDLLEQQKVTIPTLIVISEADSVVDPYAIKTLYEDNFTNPNSQLIWYGESTFKQPSIKTFTMKLDAHKISTGSHMSTLFAPHNTYYGQNGERKMCMNSFDDDASARCRAGEEVWYSAWGYEEEGKIHARLTWNPYYQNLVESIRELTQPSIDR